MAKLEELERGAAVLGILADCLVTVVDPLPHQIIAVYDYMLPRQLLRFLLADDPLRGKTIMLGLLIKQLLIRGDLHRCLIACPENLVERWQKQLYHRFQPIPKEQWIAGVPSWPNESARKCRRGSWWRNSRGSLQGS